MTTGMMTASTFMSPGLFMGLKSKIISWPIDMRTGTMIALAFVERLPDLLVHLANESVAIQELEVLLHVPSLVHHAEGVVVGDVHQGALHLLDDRGGHVVARRLHLLLIYFSSTSHLLLIYFAPALIKPPASKAKEWPPQTCTSLARLGQKKSSTRCSSATKGVARRRPSPGRAEPAAGRWAREKGLLAVAAGAPPDAFPLGTDQTN